MGVSVTEYLGQRTDIKSVISAQSSKNNICPFNGCKCEKIVKGYPPVCSIRNYGRNRSLEPSELAKYPFWIVCSHRLCSTKLLNNRLTKHQQERLLQIAKVIFSDDVDPAKIFVKSEVSVQVNDERRQDMHADYVMTYMPSDNYTGKKRVIIEMQGGGETSNTGPLSEHVREWERSTSKSNQVLRDLIPGVGILATNAWRRQQEQALVKSNIAQKTTNVDGFVLCIGEFLFNYLETKLQLSKLDCDEGDDWQAAIISFKENHNAPISDGPIPLVVDKVIKISTYMKFISAITDQGRSSPDAFVGDFTSLSNERRKIEKI